MSKIVHFEERNTSKTLQHTRNAYICNAHGCDHINEERIILPCANLTTSC